MGENLALKNWDLLAGLGKAGKPDRLTPAMGSLHLVRREVECVAFSLGQVVPTGDVALLSSFRELWWPFDEFLFPNPGDDGAEMLAGLVCPTLPIFEVSRSTRCAFRETASWRAGNFPRLSGVLFALGRLPRRPVFAPMPNRLNRRIALGVMLP